MHSVLALAPSHPPSWKRVVTLLNQAAVVLAEHGEGVDAVVLSGFGGGDVAVDDVVVDAGGVEVGGGTVASGACYVVGDGVAVGDGGGAVGRSGVRRGALAKVSGA